MASAKFWYDHQWVEAEYEGFPAYAATMARLRLGIHNFCLTEWTPLSEGDNPTDQTGQQEYATAVYEELTLPLYPLADWLSTHWWNIFYEYWSEERQRHDAYYSIAFFQRHDLALADSGFAFPDLRLQPAIEDILAYWPGSDSGAFTASRTAHLQLRFIVEAAYRYLDTEHLKHSLASLIYKVVNRLEQKGITDTDLQEIWPEIQNADPHLAAADSNDPALFNFCRTAGALGRTPWELDEAEANTIIEIYQSLPEGIRDEFFHYVELDQLQDDAQALRQLLQQPETGGNKVFSHLKAALREDTSNNLAEVVPWERGYELARQTRQLLNISDPDFTYSTTEKLTESLGQAVHGNGYDPFIQQENLPHGVPALAIPDTEGHPLVQMGTTFGYDESRKFAFARSLGDWLLPETAQEAIVTHSYSKRQRLNRAFAAEFLVPAEHLRRQVQHSQVNSDDLFYLAKDHNVSTYLIEHQLENHDIASVVKPVG
jgi:hypothetical protein